MKRKVELNEINNARLFNKNKSVTGEILTLDSGQSLGWANLNQGILYWLKEKVVNT